MIYNFNLGIGWASSGVEYAQAYRAKLLRKLGAQAKFIFTDMFPSDNIEHMTANIGFLDEEIIWLYSFFTDTRIAPVSFNLKMLEETLGDREFNFSRDGKRVKYDLPALNMFYTAYMVDEESDLVHRVEIVSNGCLIRKDYYTYCRIYSEYYGPLNNKAHLYSRRFFNEDGTTAYEEIVNGKESTYKFPDEILYTKEDLVGRMIRQLDLTKKDLLIVDRTTGMGQTVLENAGTAKVLCVIHADHFSESRTDKDHILWNNYYEYPFAQYEHFDGYITATDAQNKLFKKQFKKYKDTNINIFTIPVGSLDELRHPKGVRKMHSLITASRLAPEKHLDWLVEAVVKARQEVPDLTLDIYGKGAEEKRLEEQIAKLDAKDYITLRGQHNLTDLYVDYEAYLSASTSEGFGLTLMEAVGSGLPIIGFDVRYGNQTFIDEGENGYLIKMTDEMETSKKIEKLTECVVKLFTEADLEAFHTHSYQVAEKFLEAEVETKWSKLLKKMM